MTSMNMWFSTHSCSQLSPAPGHSLKQTHISNMTFIPYPNLSISLLLFYSLLYLCTSEHPDFVSPGSQETVLLMADEATGTRAWWNSDKEAVYRVMSFVRKTAIWCLWSTLAVHGRAQKSLYLLSVDLICPLGKLALYSFLVWPVLRSRSCRSAWSMHFREPLLGCSNSLTPHYSH